VKVHALKGAVFQHTWDIRQSNQTAIHVFLPRDDLEPLFFKACAESADGVSVGVEYEPLADGAAVAAMIFYLNLSN
jgi:hypothetical protein